MKKIIRILIILLIITIIPVNAANYNIKETIPKELETTVRTDKFTYGSMIYQNGTITINRAISLQDENKPLTFTVALLDKEKIIIGLLKYCSSHDTSLSDDKKTLTPHVETRYDIPITNEYLQEGKRVMDIDYISILDENLNCNQEKTDSYYYGTTIENIGVHAESAMDSKAEFSIQIFMVVGGLLLLFIIYQFVFTNAHQNVNGDGVRQAYEEYNKELALEREAELIKNPPKPKEVKKEKTDEVIKQEKQATKEKEEGTDLHNLYR